jgi:hypothetical protein
MISIRPNRTISLAILITGLYSATAPGALPADDATIPRAVRRKIVAEVVAIDQCYFYNRLGAHAPDGMIYALRRDVVLKEGSKGLTPGNVQLRQDKRPRPLVLRMNVGDLLEVHFTNLLLDTPPTNGSPTRYAGLSVFGLELVDEVGKPLTGVEHSGSYVGANPSSLAPPAKPGETKVYRFFAPAEGTFLMSSYADTTGSQSSSGLFGAVNVQPEGAEYYRSQVTHDDLRQATVRPKEQGGSYSIPGQEFVTLSRQETDEDKLLQGKPEAQVEAGRPPLLRGTKANRKFTLTRVDPSRRTGNMTSVELTDDGRLLGESGHPLIDYLATYSTGPYVGKSVLNMLEAATDSKPEIFAVNLPTTGDGADSPSDLSAGIISTWLKDQFVANKSKLPNEALLSEEASVTRAPQLNGDRGAWLITDVQGRAYVVKQPEAKPRSLDIYTATFKLVYGDLTAVITGPGAGSFPTTNTSPSFRQNPALPERRQPYREYTILYHQMSPAAIQAFPQFAATNDSGYLQNSLAPSKDEFGINYGIAGIAAEVLANRLGVGPMGRDDAVDLKYEEFFLSAWAVGDPAMVVNTPANTSPKVPGAGAPASSPETQPPTTTEADATKATRPQEKTGQTQRRPGRYVRSEAMRSTNAPLVTPVKNLYPDDPSNVYHSYMRDHVKFRILHAGGTAGGGPSHVHHLHAHQWLRTPNSDDSTYLDSQLIIPGVAYTLEIAYGGSGNRNLTVGDSIFHCHFYPHFAAGMWSLWRVHDVFEAGTVLDKEGNAAEGERALPDGEIARGTPIPAIVPLPTLGMAPLPAKVHLIDGGRRVEVEPSRTSAGNVVVDKQGAPVYDRNPGFPFFIPGVSGHRAPHPPLDFAWKEQPDHPGEPLPRRDEKGEIVKNADGETAKQYLDGGLPRHLVLGGEIIRHFETRWDFTKDFVLYDSEDKTKPDRKVVGGSLKAFELPEEGTAVEKIAMATHAQRTHKTVLPNGFPGNFILNGLPPASGAPFAAPDVSDQGNSNKTTTRRYKAAALQMDVVQTRKGWHYPQQRFLTLWGDIRETVAGIRPPEPFFFRSSTGDTIEFWHTNLVPSYYELDDFQVRTPTDLLGQHIHLVKFDVTASDGAGNGFNYEDGTFSPDEVRERIDALEATNGKFYAFDPKTQFADPNKTVPISVKPYDEEYDHIFGPPPAGQNWNGAQTTIQRWDTDPLLNNDGVDRTLRTVFTHDHFGPSTHQQVGLYAGLLIEPANSNWYLPDGTRMNTRFDGGPTSWNGYIVPADSSESYREFALEFADSQLSYNKDSTYSPTLPYISFLTLTGIKASDLKPGRLPDVNPPPSVRALFATMGLVLTDDAKVTVVEPGKAWTISEDLVANPRDDAQRETFRVRLENSNGSPVLNVYRPSALFNFSFPAADYAQEYEATRKLLNAGGLIPANSPIRTQFKNAGITLAADATLAVVLNNQLWTVTCESQREIYRVRNNFVGFDYVEKNPPHPPVTKHVDTVLQVYTPTMTPGWADPANALNAVAKDLDGRATPTSPLFLNQQNGAPFPQLIIAGRQGTMALNYRAEPVPLRLGDPKDQSGDLAFAYRSDVKRQDPDLNVQPAFFAMDVALESKLTPGPVATEIVAAFAKGGVTLSSTATVTVVEPGSRWDIADAPTVYSIRKLSPLYKKAELYTFTKIPGTDRVFPPPIVPLSVDPKDGGVTGGDPFTPLLRAYANDKVQIRTLVGAHLIPHSFQLSGVKWSTEAADLNSAYRNAQIMGLSEHYEMLFTMPPATTDAGRKDPRPFADYWYAPGSDPAGQGNGLWGLMRAYDHIAAPKGSPTYLEPLPSNRSAGASSPILNYEELYKAAVAAKRPTRKFDVTAVTASQVEPGGVLSYNDRAKITDPNAILFVRTDDVEVGTINTKINWKLKSPLPTEPLILRAAAGEWIELTVRNFVDPKAQVFQPGSIAAVGNLGYFGPSALFTQNPILVSSTVGLHPSLLAYDVRHADGMNVGYNPTQTLKTNFPTSPADKRTVYLYAGNLELQRTWDGKQVVKESPVEFGAINLVPTDPMFQHMTGLYGGLIVEPEGSHWVEDANTRTSAVVAKADGTTFRELVLLWQNDLANFTLATTTYGAVNYRSEPYAARNIPSSPQGNEAVYSNKDLTPPADPQTPILVSPARMPTRFRMLYPGGSTNNGGNAPAILVLQGHDWQEEPYMAGGTKIGDNRLSQHVGSQEHSAYEALNMILPSAGGKFGVAGDYLYHSYMMEQNNGTWGLFRVKPDVVAITRAHVDPLKQLIAQGYGTQGKDGKFAPNVTLYSVELDGARKITTKTLLATVDVEPSTGHWRLDPSIKKVPLAKTTLIHAESAPGQSPIAPVKVEVP